MTDQQFQQLMNILGQIGNNAYQAALRQVYIDGWTAIIWGTLFFIITGALLVLAIWGIKNIGNKSTYNGDDDLYGWSMLLGGMSSLGFLLLALMNINTAISMFLSPNWQAIQYLAHLVK